MQQNSNLQQNILNIFASILQTTTQPPLTQLTQDTLPETQLKGSRRGKGKTKKKGKSVAKK